MRQALPQRRAAETFNLRFWNQLFSVTVGFYADGTLGEVFIDSSKTGQDIQSTARDAAVVLSLALQHGTSIEAIRHAVTRSGSGSAASILGAVVDALSTEAAHEPFANPTPRDARKTSRTVARAGEAHAAMRVGQTLHLEHRDGRRHWSLSDGRPVTADAAAILIHHADVVPADGALFSDLPGQTWRYR